MNHFNFPGRFFRLIYRIALHGRWIGSKPISKSFGRKVDQNPETIQQIYVINLDRHPLRWQQMQQELQRIQDRNRNPLIELTQRFSAIDAKDYTRGAPSNSVIETQYTLADQLLVDPQPAVSPSQINMDQCIQMTRQEVAIALSHIEVWKQIACGDNDYVLVLEDDVYFSRHFAKFTDQVWKDIRDAYGFLPSFDLLYLSYKEVKTRAQKIDISDFVFKPYRGLWYFSGYVLSKQGANTLLSLLPIRGPVDLWINHQYEKLKVLASSKSVIKQRLDSQSSNSYSILPVLSKIGVLSNEKPSLFESKLLKKPVFAFGGYGTGLTSLAMALSMLGYRCCSDISELPITEEENLFNKKKELVFDAYVNVGSLIKRYIELAKLYPEARFIITVNTEAELNQLNADMVNQPKFQNKTDGLNDVENITNQIRQISENVLILSAQTLDKWKQLCEFLDCISPTSQYPDLPDQIQRPLFQKNIDDTQKHFPKTRRLKFDTSPWIAVSKGNWNGIPINIDSVEPIQDKIPITVFDQFRQIDKSFWELRDDTFPSNLALFDPSNFAVTSDGALLKLHKQRSGVRDYSATSICSQQMFLYGRFEAEIRPSNVPGVITGLFLHRNSPRQEIDIEFLGKDTTKLLLNVYYNPGGDGAMFDYGYRGTPVIINLDFDASQNFHWYAIEWTPSAIRWFVDNRLVHERFNWGPTPIPHLPMQFHLNLWPTRSVELAGKLLDHKLPTTSTVKAIHIKTFLLKNNKHN